MTKLHRRGFFTLLAAAVASRDPIRDGVRDFFARLRKQPLPVLTVKRPARFPQGATFTIPGCYIVNPLTRKSTGILVNFREINGTLWPPRVDEGPYQNCTKAERIQA